MPCSRPSEPNPSPWLQLKTLADEISHIPDTPIEPLQNEFEFYKLMFIDILTEYGQDYDFYKVALRTLELADTNSAASIRNAVQAVLGFIP